MVSHVGGGRCGEEVALRGFPALFPQRRGGARAGGGAARPRPEPGPRPRCWGGGSEGAVSRPLPSGTKPWLEERRRPRPQERGAPVAAPIPGSAGCEAELRRVMAGGVFSGLTVLLSPPSLSFSGAAVLNQVTTSSMQQDRLFLVTQET